MNDIKNKTFRLKVKTTVSKIGENAILLDLNSGTYFELNEVALIIINNLNDFISFNSIKEVVVNNFEVDDDKSERDILVFLQKLIEMNFLDIK
tara:strand:+ start:158 stop:436 length:279 start_codon:yes stop_codon:yes gene_type:complete